MQCQSSESELSMLLCVQILSPVNLPCGGDWGQLWALCPCQTLSGKISFEGSKVSKLISPWSSELLWDHREMHMFSLYISGAWILNCFHILDWLEMSSIKCSFTLRCCKIACIFKCFILLQKSNKQWKCLSRLMKWNVSPAYKMLGVA